MSKGVDGLMGNKDGSQPAGGEVALWKKQTVLGAGAALACFLSLLLVPVAGFFLSFMTPLPVLLVCYRWGIPYGYGAPAVAALAGGALLLVLGLGALAPYYLELLVLGALLARGMRLHRSIHRTVARAVLPVFVLGAVVFWVSHGGMGGDVFKKVEKGVLEALSRTVSHYRELFPEQALAEDRLRQAAALMVRLIPGVALAFAFVVGWLNLLAARKFCRVHRWPFPPWGDWSLWKSPEILVFGFIACGFLLVLPGSATRVFALNGLVALGTAYFFQGLAIVVYYFHRWRVPPFFRGMLYVILLVQQFATMAMILMGLFDIWLDFRRISRQPADGKDDRKDEDE